MGEVMEDDGAPLTAGEEAEVDELFVALGMHLRRKTVRSLLVGNDAGCFTTEQYREAYVRLNWCGQEDAGRRSLSDELCERHLKSLPRMVRMVKPGLWAAR